MKQDRLKVKNLSIIYVLTLYYAESLSFTQIDEAYLKACTLHFEVHLKYLRGNPRELNFTISLSRFYSPIITPVQ